MHLDPSSDSAVAVRFARLESHVRRLRIGLALAVLPWLAAAARHTAPDAPLRTRGIIVEDAEGRARILIGAPIPDVAERKRKDAATGIVLLSEDGRDRLQFGNVGGPQMGGVVQQRIAGATGMQVNDAKGDERGGFGLLDNGRMVLGLDSPQGEGVMLFVAPDLGMNGLMINGAGPSGPAERIRLAANRDQSGSLYFSDGHGGVRLEIGCTEDAPRIRELDGKGEPARDLLQRDK